MKLVDLTGKRFGHLTVIERAPNFHGRIMWRCECECGNIIDVDASNLKRSNETRSCGCLWRKNRKKGYAAQNRANLVGQVFSDLTVIEFAFSKNKCAFWRCKCSCGKETIVSTGALRSGNTKSCGCRSKLHPANYRHGMAKSRLNSVYFGMKERCYDPNNKAYRFYGALGVTVCDEWLGKNGFIHFSEWAKENGYQDDVAFGVCTLDRIDGTKGYSPANCRFISIQEQQNNRKDNHNVLYNGEILSVSRMARKYNLPPHVLGGRLSLGWDIDKAINTPYIPRRKRNEKI